MNISGDPYGKGSFSEEEESFTKPKVPPLPSIAQSAATFTEEPRNGPPIPEAHQVTTTLSPKIDYTATRVDRSAYNRLERLVAFISKDWANKMRYSRIKSLHEGFRSLVREGSIKNPEKSASILAELIQADPMNWIQAFEGRDSVLTFSPETPRGTHFQQQDLDLVKFLQMLINNDPNNGIENAGTVVAAIAKNNPGAAAQLLSSLEEKDRIKLEALIISKISYDEANLFCQALKKNDSSGWMDLIKEPNTPIEDKFLALQRDYLQLYKEIRVQTERDRSIENLKFLEDIFQYMSTKSNTGIEINDEEYKELYNTYIAATADLEINIPGYARNPLIAWAHAIGDGSMTDEIRENGKIALYNARSEIWKLVFEGDANSSYKKVIKELELR